MRLNSVCLVTRNVPRLRAFYALLTQTEAEGDDLFAALALDGVGLCLFAADGMESMAPGSMAGAGAGNAVLEFWVNDADVECARLKELGVPIVKLPTTQPWGLRSVWLRDPDGNIVNLFAQEAAAQGE